MLNRLMTSSAVLALVMSGAIGVAQAKDVAPGTAPAVEQGAAAATTDQGKLTPEHATLATAFMGRSVYSSADPNSDNIGDVNDLIISEDGTITKAVIGVGGFLGIGEKNVAVPFDELKVMEQDGEIRLVYASTKDQLESAPEFDRTAYDPRERFAEQQAAATPAPGTAPAGTMAPAPAPAGGMAAAPAPAPAGDVTAKPAEPADQMAAGTTAEQPMATGDQAANGDFVGYAADQVLASKVVGQSIYGPGDESIGEVGDLVIDKAGKASAALIDVGGFLGVGSKEVAIDFNKLQITPPADPSSEPKITVAMTRDELQNLPEFKGATMGEPVTTGSVDTVPANGDMTKQDMTAAPADQAATNETVAPKTSDQMAAATTDGKAGFADQSFRAETLIGTSVYDTNEKDIGEVGDVVLGMKGDVKAVVLDVGGFLGIGEKRVAISFDALQARTDDAGNLILMVDATKDQLESAPTYDETASVEGQKAVQ